MPKISDRSKQLRSPSTVEKLIRQAGAVKKTGTNVFDLAKDAFERPFDLKIFDGIEKISENIKILPYNESKGRRSYAKKIVDSYQNRGYLPSINHADIVITNSDLEAISFLFQICLDIGEEVLIPEPFHSFYREYAKICNIKLNTIESSIKEDRELTIEDIEKKLTKNTKLILLTNPNYYTGRFYSSKMIEQLVQLVHDRDIFLIIDESLSVLAYDQNTSYSILDIAGKSENFIKLDSYSKIFDFFGETTGIIITRNKTIINALWKFSATRLAPTFFGQMLGERYFQLDKFRFDNLVTSISEKTQFLWDKLNLIPEIDKVWKPTAGGIIMLELPIENSSHFSHWLLTNFEYQSSTVLILPGLGFFSNHDIGRNKIFISCAGNSLEKLDKAVNCLKVGLLEYLKTSNQAE